MKFKVGAKVQWNWLGRKINGVVKEVHTESVTKTIKGKAIKRNGSEEVPAYLVEAESGNIALKLQTELSKPMAGSGSKKAITTAKPQMFSR